MVVALTANACALGPGPGSEDRGESFAAACSRDGDQSDRQRILLVDERVRRLGHVRTARDPSAELALA